MVLVDVPLGAEPDPSRLRQRGARSGAPGPGRHGTIAFTQKRFDIPSREERQGHRLALGGVTLRRLGVGVFGAGAAPGPRRPQGSLFAAPHAMENTFLYAAIERDGTLTLVHKPTGRIYRGLLALEDGGDCGDGWVWVPPRFDQVVLSRGRPFDLARVHDGPLVAAMRLSLRLFVPAVGAGAPRGRCRPCAASGQTVAAVITPAGGGVAQAGRRRLVTTERRTTGCGCSSHGRRR